MVIFTKTGDLGETGLKNHKRYLKSNPIFDVLGNLDELNCEIGVLISSTEFTVEARNYLVSIQSELFKIGSILSNNENDKCEGGFEHLNKLTEDLENKMLEMEGLMPPLHNFIIPGGSAGASIAHRVRAVTRRVERLLVRHCKRDDAKSMPLISYINRLSDFMFVLARYINFSKDIDDTIWLDDNK